jgi:dienelactone hydrolase
MRGVLLLGRPALLGALVTVCGFGSMEVKAQELVADAFAALRLLAFHLRIDAQRIAIMGFSRGGAASWRTAVERIIAVQQLPGGLRFAAHIQLYSAGCSGILRLIIKPGVFSKAPELWIHGDADDYTPIGACQDYSKRISEAGTPVEFVSLHGLPI